MFVFLGFVLSERITGIANYEAPQIYVNDFGFQQGGTFNLTWYSETSDLLPTMLYCFNYDQYYHWISSRLSGFSYGCSENVENSFEWLATLGQKPQNKVFTINEEGVYYFVIVPCNEPSEQGRRIVVDARFANVDGLLDTRNMPIINIKSIDYPVFSVLAMSYAVWLIVKSKKNTMPIQIVFVILPIIYILYCMFMQITLIRQNASDDYQSLSIVVKVFGALYEFTLFTIIVIASSGWCLLNVDLSIVKALIGAFCVLIYVSGSYSIDYIKTVGGRLAVLCMECFGLAGVMYIVQMNTKEAKKHIKAHLMVIENNGIAPKSTPIYQKWKLYGKFLYYTGLSISLFVMTKAIFVLSDTVNYVAVAFMDSIQLLIIATLMLLYRPHGSEIDPYMRRDSGDGEREEVDLEDLDQYNFEGTESRDGMREWEDGMNLPLEPLVLSSSERTRKSLLRRNADETPYTMQQPLNPTVNI